MRIPILHAPATQGVFNATGKYYSQTTHFTYLGGAVIETLNLSGEIGRRIRARWMLQALHAGSVRSTEDKSAAPEGPDGEMRGSRGSPIGMHDIDPSLRPTTASSVKHMTLCCFESYEPGANHRTTESSPTKTPSSEPEVRVSKQPCARRGCCARRCCSTWATAG